MLRKWGIGLVVIAVVAVIGNAQGKDPDREHPIRDYFKKNRLVHALIYLKTETVRKELELTDTQKELTDPLLKEYTESMGKIYKDPKTSTAETTKLSDEACAKIVDKLISILQADQIDRLMEIMTQMSGPMIFLDANIAKTFDLTDDQKKKIQPLAEKTAKLMGTTRAKIEESATGKEDARTKFREGFKTQQPILKESDDVLQTLLTPKQRDLLGKLKGKEVDMNKLFADVAEYYLSNK